MRSAFLVLACLLFSLPARADLIDDLSFEILGHFEDVDPFFVQTGLSDGKPSGTTTTRQLIVPGDKIELQGRLTNTSDRTLDLLNLGAGAGLFTSDTSNKFVSHELWSHGPFKFSPFVIDHDPIPQLAPGGIYDFAWATVDRTAFNSIPNIKWFVLNRGSFIVNDGSSFAAIPLDNAPFAIASSFTVTPEPTSMLLYLAGAPVLFGLRRRKKV